MAFRQHELTPIAIYSFGKLHTIQYIGWREQSATCGSASINPVLFGSSRSTGPEFKMRKAAFSIIYVFILLHMCSGASGALHRDAACSAALLIHLC